MSELLLDEALRTAARLGTDDAEIVVSKSADLSVEIRNGEVEALSTAEAIGAGIRIFTDDRRMGFAYATELLGRPDHEVREKAHSLVEAAWENARANEPDEYNVLPNESVTSDDDWAEEDFAAKPAADKVEFAKAIERKTMAADARISQVQSSAYEDCLYDFTIANSRGLRRRYRNGFCSCSVSATASQEGVDSETGWEFDYARTFGALRPDWIAARCAEKAVGRLGGKPCAGGAMPVVLNDFVAMQFLRVLSSAFKANNVLKQKSLFAGRLGEQVAADCVSVADHNDYEQGLARAPFDGEGTSAQRTAVIEGGVLRTFLHSTYTAAKMGAESTANAGRGGFRSPPDVGTTTLYMAPGNTAFEDLLKQAGNGLYVDSAMGVHTADPISGDFSFGAAGKLIENGVLTRPVRGVTIAGNVKDLFMNVARLGNDLRIFGSCGAPSVLVSELMVSGETAS